MSTRMWKVIDEVERAVADGRRAWSNVLNVGYVPALVSERNENSRLLTVVEDTDGAGTCYAHYFPHEQKEYVLTDGAEVFARQAMTADELEAAVREAERATDGNLVWMDTYAYADAIRGASATSPHTR